jgi:hypothetical protein
MRIRGNVISSYEKDTPGGHIAGALKGVCFPGRW